MKPIKNIILDWSGTLVDDFPPVLAATNSIFQKFGHPNFTAEEFREKFFLPFQDFYKLYLPEVSMSDLDAFYHSSFKLLQEEIPLLPQAREFLDYIQAQGMPTFLLSTIHAEHFAVQAERLGVKSYFRQAYTQAYDKRQTILQLLAEHQLQAEETLFIGDMLHDIESARHGGVRSCAVLTGYDSLEKLKKSQPDLMFRDLGQVGRYLQRHQAGHPEQYPIATVGALIYNPLGQVLMLKTYKWSDRWGIPGGKIKRGETAVEALRRELREETGLEVEDIRYVLTQDCLDSPEFYKPSHFLLMNYTVRALSTEVTLNDEADIWHWVYPSEALELPLNQPTRLLLNQVLGSATRPIEEPDRILIEALEINLHLGVPDVERAQPQKILATITMETDPWVEAVQGEDIEKTVNYYTVAHGVKELASRRAWKLLETLVEEIANYVLSFSRVRVVTVKLEKFILPDTRCVAVQVTRKNK